MREATARWATIGRRYAAPAEVPVIVVAYTEVGSGTGGNEGGISGVRFSISRNGGAPDDVFVSTVEACEPNHSAVASLIPGATPGKMAGLRAYRTTLTLDGTDCGIVEVAATAISVAGRETELDFPITIHDDSDGVDRRPTTHHVWVADDGNDSTGDGTEGNAFASVQKAFAGEMGGATVHIRGNIVWGNTPDSYSNWWTSDKHRATIVWENGATATRTTLTTDGFFYGGTTPGSSNFVTLLRPQFVGWGGVLYNDPAVETDVWIDGGGQSSSHYNPVSKRWSVRFFEENQKMFKLTSLSANARMRATNVRWAGVAAGPSEFYSVHDCIIEDYLGIANEPFDRAFFINTIARHQRAYRDVVGRVRGPVTGGSITVPVAGQMRIDVPGPLAFSSEGDFAPMTLATLTEIAGVSFWRLVCSGLDSGNNGTFEILSAGTDGSGSYVVVANPSAVAQASIGSGSKVETAYSNGEADLVHSDLVFFGGPTQTDTLLYGVVSYDLDSTQTFFSSNTNFVRLVMVWCRDGNNKSLNANMIGGSKTDCLFFRNTIAGNWQMGGTQTGCQTIDNVFAEASGIDATGTNTVSHNHFISGSTFGSSATTGAWFPTGSDPEADPWDFTPDASRFGNASGLTPDVSDYWHAGAAGSTRGVGRDGATFDWSLGDGEGEIGGAATGVASASAAITGRGALAGGASGSAALSCSLVDASSIAGAATGITSATAIVSGIGALAGSASGVGVGTSVLRDASEISGVVTGAASLLAALSGYGAVVAFAAGSTSTSCRFAATGAPVEPGEATPTAADVEAAIVATALAPAAVSGDGSSVHSQSLPGLIEAHKYLRSRGATRSGGLGIGIRRIVPPGA